MLKCSQCGQYYVPGYLECHCQIMLHTIKTSAVGQFPSSENLALGASEFPVSSAASVATAVPHPTTAPNRAAVSS